MPAYSGRVLFAPRALKNPRDLSSSSTNPTFNKQSYDNFFISEPASIHHSHHIPNLPTSSTSSASTQNRIPNTITPSTSSSFARKPQKGREINNNSFRPHVKADERLQKWTTPYSLEQRSYNLSKFPKAIIDAGDDIVATAFAPGSKTTYAAGLLRFNQFCDKFNIDERDRMPVHEILLIGFIGHNRGQQSGKTMKNWLSGLKAWHDLNGAKWPTESRLVRLARRGANIEGAHRKRAPRHPITLEHLRVLHKALDFSLPFHCAIWACATTAFWGCRRLGNETFLQILFYYYHSYIHIQAN